MTVVAVDADGHVEENVAHYVLQQGLSGENSSVRYPLGDEAVRPGFACHADAGCIAPLVAELVIDAQSSIRRAEVDHIDPV